MKKLLSTILMVFMVVIMSGTTVFAEDTKVGSANSISMKDKIIKEYRDRLFKYKKNENEAVSVERIREEQTLSQIQSNAVSELNQAGYEAYDISPQTFEATEEVLNTNLEDAGLSPDGSYIVVIEGEENASDITPYSDVSSSFTHRYNGTTYTLRWMTIYVTDDPYMDKYSYKNVLDSNSRRVIQNFLDTAVDIYVGAIWQPLGTMSSILGLNISDFMESYDAYLNYNATSTWTRRYTQVLCSYYNIWTNGCCVEEVQAASYLNGWYYNSSTKSKEQYITDTNYRYIYSDRFNDFEWRKDYAVIGYLNSWIQWDVTDDVEHRYNGDVIIKHHHNF